MSMADLFALLRTTTVAQLLERDDFAKRFASGEPISVLELLYPLLQGLRLGRGQRRRRARRDRPEVQPAARARHPARLRPARAGDHDPAAADRNRRRAQDVQVVRQLHRRHRGARGDVRQDDEHPRLARWSRGTGCCWDASCPPIWGRGTPSGRSRGRSSTVPRRRRGRRSRGGVRPDPRTPRRSGRHARRARGSATGRGSTCRRCSRRRSGSRRRRRGATLPAAASSSTASPWPTGRSTSMPPTSTARCCSSASAASRACA